MVVRSLQTPITEAQLTSPEPGLAAISFKPPLDEREYLRVGAFMREHPALALRIWGLAIVPDLTFLRHFSFVRDVYVDCWRLQSFAGLELLSPQLERLVLGRTIARGLSVRALANFPALRSLALEGHRKHLEVIAGLPDLRSVTLRSISLPDLSIVASLPRLRALDLKLGGIRDLRLLGALPTLQYLEIWLVRGVSNLDAVANLRALRYLKLQALKHVEALPSLRDLSELKYAWIETMKGLETLQGLSDAPALEELFATDMGSLQPDDFRPFVGHPALRSARIGLGSVRKTTEVRALLGLPWLDLYSVPALREEMTSSP